MALQNSSSLSSAMINEFLGGENSLFIKLLMYSPSLFNQLLLAGNYTTKRSDMKNNDIFNELVDKVASIGAYHHIIDAPTLHQLPEYKSLIDNLNKGTEILIGLNVNPESTIVKHYVKGAKNMGELIMKLILKIKVDPNLKLPKVILSNPTNVADESNYEDVNVVTDEGANTLLNRLQELSTNNLPSMQAELKTCWDNREKALKAFEQMEDNCLKSGGEPLKKEQGQGQEQEKGQEKEQGQDQSKSAEPSNEIKDKLIEQGKELESTLKTLSPTDPASISNGVSALKKTLLAITGIIGGLSAAVTIPAAIDSFVSTNSSSSSAMKTVLDYIPGKDWHGIGEKTKQAIDKITSMGKDDMKANGLKTFLALGSIAALVGPIVYMIYKLTKSKSNPNKSVPIPETSIISSSATVKSQFLPFIINLSQHITSEVKIEDFELFIKNKLADMYRNEIKTYYPCFYKKMHPAVSVDTSEVLFKIVGDPETLVGLNAETRMFYDKNLRAVNTNTGTAYKLKDVASGKVSYDPKNSRLNLSKNPDGSTVFETMLPLIDESKYGDLYISYVDKRTNKNMLMKIMKGKFGSDILRRVYRAASEGVVLSLDDGKTTIALPPYDFETASRGFNIDGKQLYFNTIETKSGETMNESFVVDELLKKYENQVVEVSTGAVWYRDEDMKLYKLDGDKKVYEDSPELYGKCYGTGLSLDDDECSTLLACIANGTNQDVNACMQLKDYKNFFEKYDLNTASPKVLKLILHNMGVNQYTKNGTNMAESFDHFVERISRNKDDVNSRLKNISNIVVKLENTNGLVYETLEQWVSRCKNNTDLAGNLESFDTNCFFKFLKDVIAYVNSNPSILNKIIYNRNDKIQTRLPNILGSFKRPELFSVSSNPERTSLDMSRRMYETFSVRPPMPLINPYGNSFMMQNQNRPFMSNMFNMLQRGGHMPPMNTTLENIEMMINNSTKNLSRYGYEVSSDDLAKIKHGINYGKRLEKVLIELSNKLKKVSDLEYAFSNVSSNSVGDKSTMSIDELLNFYKSNKNEISKCLEKNYSASFEVCSKLAKINKSMNETLSAGSNAGSSAGSNAGSQLVPF